MFGERWKCRDNEHLWDYSCWWDTHLFITHTIHLLFLHTQTQWSTQILCRLKKQMYNIDTYYACSLKVNVFVSLATASIGYTIKVNQGANVQLPCHYPPNSQVVANTVWFKETDTLNLEDENNKKMERLYPLDTDQTIVLRNALIEDAGLYHCESVDKEKLSTVYLVVEGRFYNLFYILQ